MLVRESTAPALGEHVIDTPQAKTAPAPPAASRGRFTALATAVFVGLPLLFAFGPSQAESVERAADTSQSFVPRAAEPAGPCVQRLLRPLAETAAIAVPASDAPPSPLPTDGAAGGAAGAAGAGGAHDGSAGDGSSPPWARPLDGLLDALTADCSVRLESLIATVADPIDSGLGYQFDTTLQALRLGVETELGAESARYYRDRSWLPWDDRDGPPEQTAASAECRRDLPGVVLFRGSDPDERRLLALLLVGETPTTGLHVGAMLQALAIDDALSRRTERCDDGSARAPVRIVGPTFSGTARSLRTALERFAALAPASAREARIVTGSATGSALNTLLRREPGASSGEPGIQFATTTAAESDVQCAYLRYLHHFLGYGPGRDPSGAPRPLPGVALLHESGTEFGAAMQSGGRGCPFSASIDIAFPAHVSLLRDAYEDLDRQRSNGATAEAIARGTSLSVSLRERRRPLTLEAEPSPKTTYAQDVALSKVLGAISRSGVRHVGVQATDIADAIFLSRRIRDVAPDVRLAFFASDVLLLHPAFERDLAGSLVITPYPFLGSTELATATTSRGRRSHQGLESSASAGIYNAVLASRGARTDQLLEYSFTPEGTRLPLWITAVGSTSLVPISLAPNADRERLVYSGERHFTDREPQPGARSGRGAYRRLRSSELGLEHDARIPRLWHFVYLVLALTFVVDRLLQRRVLRTLSMVPIPGRLGRREDRDADLAIVRTKWRLYAAIRTYVLAFGLGYMSLIYFLAFFTYWPGGAPPLLATFAVGLVALGATACAARDAYRFALDYTALGRCVHGRSPLVWLTRLWSRVRPHRSPPPPSRAPLSNEQSIDSALEEDPTVRDNWDRVSSPFGFARPEGRIPAARTSFAQLRLLANFALLIALAFTAGQLWTVFEEARFRLAVDHPIPQSTLLALRSLPIVNTVSPAAPTLWCLLGVYAWSIGRMARLRLAAALSRISPDDGVADLVSTPIRVILHPSHGYGKMADESFTRVERRALNAIVRPNTGPSYFLALLAIVVVPVALFVLKPPSTLERPATTLLLFGGLALLVVLIGNTLVQLIEHWVSLEHLLKRVFQHRLGRAFDRVAGFARESVHQQLSRAPHDLLRLSGCAVRFDQLVRAGQALDESGLAAEARDELAQRSRALDSLRREALSASTHRDLSAGAAAEAALGKAVLEAAREVMRLLLQAWDGQLASTRSPTPSEPAPAEGGAPVDPTELGDDALSAEAHRYSALEFRWLREAEAYVVTVVALLINRHVRQFQYFMYTLTTASLLLLCAISSYPFEPQRLLLTSIWVIVGSVVAVGLFVYVELDRNALISRLAGTPPGRMTLDGALALRLLAWVIVPLLSVAAAQYPDLANKLFSAVEPFARTLR